MPRPIADVVVKIIENDPRMVNPMPLRTHIIFNSDYTQNDK